MARVGLMSVSRDNGMRKGMRDGKCILEATGKR